MIVATSSLELGLDVGDLDRAIQINAPGTVSSFLQRMGRTGRRQGAKSNCLFLTTSDEGFLRAAALLDLWKTGYIEPVKAPAKPYHILAQQLMALVLQERGIGRHSWLEWVSDVPAFAAMSPERIEEIVSHLLATGILWSDDGILSFAKGGEEEYGRKHFMELLSVFTSPPLFRVVCGQKELGSVHESTFYKRQEGPTILVLAGQSWKTSHLDWPRRIAHVEPADERGQSRWLGEGQFLSFEVCQSIRHVLAGEFIEEFWSKRAKEKAQELRHEHPWVYADSTTLLQTPSGEVQWWTFAGGIANAVLSEQLVPGHQRRTDNLCIRFPSAVALTDVEVLLKERLGADFILTPDEDAVASLKFAECLPSEVAADVFSTRFLLLRKHFRLSEINTAELWRLAQVPNTFDFLGVVK